MPSLRSHARRRSSAWAVVTSAMVLLASCGGVGSSATGQRRPGASTSSSRGAGHASTTAPQALTTTTVPIPSHLPVPQPLTPLGVVSANGQGVWTPAGRLVGGLPGVYETTLVPPGGVQAAGIAWMDTRLLSTQLYSGSISPGGGPYHFTAPVQPAQAASLVAVFNGGFQMDTARGGYYTEGRLVAPLVAGAASLVIYADGSVNIGAWGSDVTMTRNVVAVRQNLVPLVAGGQPTAQAKGDWQSWGATCGATSCAKSVPGIEQQWRSGIGVTADGALVYVTGPALDPLQLAQLLVRAAVVQGMELDINPYWTVFVTYNPPTPDGLAAPPNGSKLLEATAQGPSTFFNPAWARDFVTLSARPAPRG